MLEVDINKLDDGNTHTIKKNSMSLVDLTSITSYTLLLFKNVFNANWPALTSIIEVYQLTGE